MKVISTNIGKKTSLLWKGKEISTGIVKKDTNVPLILGLEDVQDDVVIDRRYHGGIDKAVYAYGAQHYNYWQELYPTVTMQHGFFGENLTISNLDENNIYVGDIFELGTAVIQATKPRQPCMKLGIVFGTQKVLKQFWNVPKCGIYFKIIKEGSVEKGAVLKLTESSKNSKTIAEIYTEKRKKKSIE